MSVTSSEPNDLPTCEVPLPEPSPIDTIEGKVKT